MVFGMISAAIARRKAPQHEDAYFGRMRFMRDHWLGQAPNQHQQTIEVMLEGGNAERRDFSRQQAMYEKVLLRCTEVVDQARPLIEQFVEDKGYGPRESPGFFDNPRLEHVLLPDPDAMDMRWDLTVLGPWPGFRQRSDDDNPDDNEAMFVIEMNGWQPTAVDLA